MPATTPTQTESERRSDAAEQRPSPYDRPFDDSRIVKYGETPGWEVLRQVAQPIPAVDASFAALIAEMGDIMYNAHGVGLAAPQIGRSIRLLVYDAGEGLRALINPAILKMRGEQTEPEEGCLSIPGLRGVVRRANEITVKALDGTGRPIRFRATEFEARVIQHEMDHLDGVLFIDRAAPETLHMEPADPAQADAPAE